MQLFYLFKRIDSTQKYIEAFESVKSKDCPFYAKINDAEQTDLTIKKKRKIHS